MAAAVAACGTASGSGSGSGSTRSHSTVYDTSYARRQATRLLGLIRLPQNARRSQREPAGAGAALASYSVDVPVDPHLVDLHEFFVVPSTTPARLIDWIEHHRPAGSAQDDSGSGPGEVWTSFGFHGLRGFAVWPTLVANAVQLANGAVAVRVDAQAAPRPTLPRGGRGPGEVRVVELGTMRGSFAYSLRCDPPAGTLPDPARVCAAIVADPALLYSLPGPDHSCPAGAPTILLRGSWNGRPLHSTFSVCTGGQEQSAARWASLLPPPAARTPSVTNSVRNKRRS